MSSPVQSAWCEKQTIYVTISVLIVVAAILLLITKIQKVQAIEQAVIDPDLAQVTEKQAARMDVAAIVCILVAGAVFAVKAYSCRPRGSYPVLSRMGGPYSMRQ